MPSEDRENSNGIAPITQGEVVFARLPRDGAIVSVIPDKETLVKIAEDLELIDLRKLRLDGRFVPEGKADWRFTGLLGATVIQPCTVTLAPVTTRIEEPITRLYVADWDTPDAGSETEMPEDESVEPLPRALELIDLVHEALALALPLYPRADGVDFDGETVTEPGVAPMSDEDTKPFAGLAALRDKLGSKEEDS